MPMNVSSLPTTPLRTRRAFRLLMLSLLATAPAQAAEVGLVNTQPLAFGSFTVGSGSVSISPSGARTASGEVVGLSADPGHAAQFTVDGDPAMTYAISLPADGTVTLSNGTSSMPVNGFTSDPAGSGVLSGSGSQVLSVGATLEVTASQPPGSYSGGFTVTVNYN